MSHPPTTQAAVWRGHGQVAVEDVDVAALRPGEVLVRVLLATVCGSDRHTVAGKRPGACPSVLGHEAVGEVLAVGVGEVTTVSGSAVAPGDRVIWGVTVSCGRCDRCRSGMTAKCRTVRKIGHEPFESAWPLSGGYAGHVLLPRGTAIARVPVELPDAVAAPAACATATVMAVLERVGSVAGRRVLVSGAGMLGITATAAAADRGAAEVIAVDVDPERLVLAREFGATTIQFAGEPLPQVDIALEFSGSSAAATVCLDRLDVGGTLVLAGAASPAADVPLDPERVVRRWLAILGVHNYEPRHLEEALGFLAATADVRPWCELVERPVPLDQIGVLLSGSAGHRPRQAVQP